MNPFLLQASVLGPVNSKANELLLQAAGLAFGKPVMHRSAYNLLTMLLAVIELPPRATVRSNCKFPAWLGLN